MSHPVVSPMVRSAYDLQKLRIALGNRIAAAVKTEMGQVPGEKEETIEDQEAQKVLEKIRSSYKRITDGLATLPRENKFKGDSVISSYGLLIMVDQYMRFLELEQRSFRQFEKVLKGYPIYAWLQSIKGIGPAMSGVLISEINIHNSKYPSSLWALAGLDVASDGRGRSRRREHLVKRKYTDKEGKEAERDSITFCPFLKTKLMGVLADSFIRAGNETYRKIYDDYKHRISTNPRHEEKTKAHIHLMSKRYMVKMFLRDLYVQWRTIEGLPVAETYHAGVQGHIHGKGPQDG